MSMQNNHIPTILIIGAGLGGLSLYHGIQKNLNKNEKNFNVKIFERDTGPQVRWQGCHVAINSYGVRSLIYCLPKSLVARLPETIPNLIEKESHELLAKDYKGAELFRKPAIRTKSLFELATIYDNISVISSYRNKLRDLILEGVDVQWGKKCIGYEELDNEVWAIFNNGTRVKGDILIGCDGIHSPIRKQRLPNLQTFDFGCTHVTFDITPNKELMDRFIAIFENHQLQTSSGHDGDILLSAMRLIPIETDITENTPDDQIHYQLSFFYFYYTHWDKHVHVDDNNPQSVINHIKNTIKQHRKPCKLTDIFLELVSITPISPPKGSEKRNYNPPRRKPVRDIDPASIEPWESTNVTLLGDAVHAVNPIIGLGLNSALQDAELLVKCLLNFEKDGYKLCIQKYENEMRLRSSRDVHESRKNFLNMHLLKGEYEHLFHNIYVSGKL